MRRRWLRTACRPAHTGTVGPRLVFQARTPVRLGPRHAPLAVRPRVQARPLRLGAPRCRAQPARCATSPAAQPSPTAPHAANPTPRPPTRPEAPPPNGATDMRTAPASGSRSSHATPTAPSAAPAAPPHPPSPTTIRSHDVSWSRKATIRTIRNTEEVAATAATASQPPRISPADGTTARRHTGRLRLT